MTDKRIVEIDGVKLEIDTREARNVESYRVGDNVKVLMKKYDRYEVFPGVIVEFLEFEKLPTIVIAILETSYDKADVKFVSFNSDSDIEIAPSDAHELTLDKNHVVELMGREIDKKLLEAHELQDKLRWFQKNFARHFDNVGAYEPVKAGEE